MNVTTLIRSQKAIEYLEQELLYYQDLLAKTHSVNKCKQYKEQIEQITYFLQAHNGTVAMFKEKGYRERLALDTGNYEIVEINNDSICGITRHILSQKTIDKLIAQNVNYRVYPKGTGKQLEQYQNELEEIYKRTVELEEKISDLELLAID